MRHLSFSHFFFRSIFLSGFSIVYSVFVGNLFFGAVIFVIYVTPQTLHVHHPSTVTVITGYARAPINKADTYATQSRHSRDRIGLSLVARTHKEILLTKAETALIGCVCMVYTRSASLALSLPLSRKHQTNYRIYSLSLTLIQLYTHYTKSSPSMTVAK